MRHRESRILGAVCVCAPASGSIGGQVGFAPSSCPPPRPRMLGQVALTTRPARVVELGRARALVGQGLGPGLIWRSWTLTLVSMAAVRVVGEDPGMMTWAMTAV